MFIGQLPGLGTLSSATEQSKSAHLRPQVPDLDSVTQILEAAELTPAHATEFVIRPEVSRTVATFGSLLQVHGSSGTLREVWFINM